MGCAMIEYISHSVILVLGPMIAMHFYPNTSFPRVGFYTALLSGSGYLGHVISCRVWISLAKTLNSSKGVILWGLAIIGTGFFSLLLCQSLLAMTIVRFTTGLFSGVIPVAQIQIDNICGNRQSSMALTTKYVGMFIGASLTFMLVLAGKKLTRTTLTEEQDAALYFYPLGVVSMLSWIAVVVTLVGLKMRSRSSYMQVSNDDVTSGLGSPEATALEDATSPQHAATVASGATNSLDRVKSAFEEAFRLNRSPAKRLLAAPNPHFRAIRRILPHYIHGFSSSGHVVIWDFLGQVKMDRLHSAGFTTVDIRDHYQFFLTFAMEKLTKSTSQKVVYVVDLEGLTLTDADERAVESACSVIDSLQEHFPDKLSKLAVINAPVWFSQVMSAVRPHVPKKTADKISFFRKETLNEDLLNLIGVDSLPRKYGGRNSVEIGKSSQERALDDLLNQTTGHLEQTKEVIDARGQTRRRTNSVRSEGDDSDEDAFFDSLEYGLQDEDDDISIVIHSQSMAPYTEAVVRNAVSPPKPKRKNSAETVKLDHLAPADALSEDLALSHEPHACLILAVFFFWALAQVSFDEVLPLWFFRHNPVASEVTPNPLPTSVSSLTLRISATFSIVSMSLVVAQLLFSTFSSNVMTPLATLRVGLLFQIPVIGCFPLIDLLHLDKLPISSLLLVMLIIAKHLTSAVAMHGLVTLLDNSINVDRRLAVHRASYLVTYAACFLASGVSPSLFALLGYFAKSFPFDQSLLYFVQALGLVFLFFFSFLIPSRLNFPQLFAMGKR
ncbi:TPA: hypothetical protein N0F65_006848 [Lagenidium giganteum]|uniref:CRAL-TRIO domain-containing protein n=1 Tax=Lagenidium giganteum TaxID=4803 RepID=A0AAV2ZCC9_9STRA|nr:TPA: hypothetical protein N0F65_006848 [Lagenidium giganteum]